jgi:hypothetical protein
MITEAKYLEAIEIVNEYTKQETDKFLKNSILSKTPNELDYCADKLDLSVRLWNILRLQLAEVRLCDITKIHLKTIGVGMKSWKEFLEFKESLKSWKEFLAFKESLNPQKFKI